MQHEMLYLLHEARRAVLGPLADVAAATSKLYRHPLSPLTAVPGARSAAASFDLFHRLAKEYPKPAFGIHEVSVGDRQVAVREEVLLQKPFCRLIRFKRLTDDAALLDRLSKEPAVLVVAPLSGHYATLLRETVRALLQDHDVYITDWTNARLVPIQVGPFHLDDYIAYVEAFIRHLGRAVHVIAVCQPTVPVLAAISLMASRGEATPRTLTLMGGPVDARESPTAVNKLATTRSYAWFEAAMIYRVPPGLPGAFRRVYPGFLQLSSFVAMNPKRHMKSHFEYFVDELRGESTEAHREFYDEYNAVLDMPAEYYLDTVKHVFQTFSLAKGTLTVRGELVRPAAIKTTALLTVEGELDDISGPGQTRAAHALCAGIPAPRKRHFTAPGAGHYGIFSGRRWREVVYPEIRDFIRANDA
jgi:poly(3-hydroxybutyrate) depolymerase